MPPRRSFRPEGLGLLRPGNVNRVIQPPASFPAWPKSLTGVGLLVSLYFVMESYLQTRVKLDD
jgi:hypothetical protein